MFVWECLKTEGKHLGMCMDGFMFGSCCVHDEEQNQVDLEADTETTTLPTTLSTTTTVKTDSTRPTRPSRPSKPSHHHVKWPNFHLVQDQQSGNNVDASDNVKTSSHFVSVTAPQDPRPTLSTKYEIYFTQSDYCPRYNFQSTFSKILFEMIVVAVISTYSNKKETKKLFQVLF